MSKKCQDVKNNVKQMLKMSRRVKQCQTNVKPMSYKCQTKIKQMSNKSQTNVKRTSKMTIIQKCKKDSQTKCEKCGKKHEQHPKTSNARTRMHKM